MIRKQNNRLTKKIINGIGKALNESLTTNSISNMLNALDALRNAMTEDIDETTRNKVYALGEYIDSKYGYQAFADKWYALCQKRFACTQNGLQKATQELAKLFSMYGVDIEMEEGPERENDHLVKDFKDYKYYTIKTKGYGTIQDAMGMMDNMLVINVDDNYIKFDSQRYDD